MAIIINGTLNIDGVNKTNIKKEKPFVQSYAFSVYINGDACEQRFDTYLIYSASPVLGIGSTLYTDLALTIPTTYIAISDPVNVGYYGLSGNTIISDNGCD
jgi:hypothetical protein